MSLLKKILVPLLVVAVGGVVAYFVATSKPAVERETPESPPPLVTVIEARRADVPLDVASQGTVEPRTESTLVAQVAGRILSVSRDFAEGSFVRAGQTLVRIDPDDYELAVEQAQAQVASAETRLQLEEAEAEVARQEWRELGRGEPTALAAREPQVREARAALESARANLAQARLHLERTTVEAPFDGRIRTKQADVGQFVSPGTPLATVFATDWAEVRLPVPKDQLAFLDLDLDRNRTDGAGPEVRLSADIGGGPRTWSARVVRTGGTLDTRTRMLDVFARVDDPYGRRGSRRRADGKGETGGAGDWMPLPMGLFVEARIAGKVARDAVRAPRVALRPDGRLMVVDGDDRLRFREVEVIRTEGDSVVVGSGIEEGERIPVSPLETPVDGMRVRTSLADESERTEASDAPQTAPTPEAPL